MLAKYNLYVGNSVDRSWNVTPLENPTGIQESKTIGFFNGFTDDNPVIGTITFSSTNYWSSTVSSYPVYVYDKKFAIYNHVENYKKYLKSHGTEIEEARLINMGELEKLGCSRLNKSCSNAPEWVYGTSYWSGEAVSSSSVLYVASTALFDGNIYSSDRYYGVRLVITVLKSEF